MNAHQLAVQTWFASLSSQWQAAPRDMTDAQANALNQLIGRGLVEARIEVVMPVEGREALRATWRVTGGYDSLNLNDEESPLRSQVREFLQNRFEDGVKSLDTRYALTQVRLTAKGEQTQESLRQSETPDYSAFGGATGDEWDNVDPVIVRDTPQEREPAKFSDPVAVAIAMKAKNPQMTIREIAEAVGMPYSTLAKKPLWQQTTARMKQLGTANVRRGTKTDGEIEAIDE